MSLRHALLTLALFLAVAGQPAAQSAADTFKDNIHNLKALHPGRMAVGDTGPLFRPAITVKEIIDDTTMIVTVYGEGVTFIISGESTKGLADGRNLVTSYTKKYKVSKILKRGTRTMYVVEPVPEKAKD
jgi:hypothetical protein